MFRRRGANHTDDYDQQAGACATAALATSVAEIKQAYLELEQAWRCLAAKGDASPGDAADPWLRVQTSNWRPPQRQPSGPRQRARPSTARE